MKGGRLPKKGEIWAYLPALDDERKPFWVGETVCKKKDNASEWSIQYLDSNNSSPFSGVYVPCWDIKNGSVAQVKKPSWEKTMRTVGIADIDSIVFGPLYFVGGKKQVIFTQETISNLKAIMFIDYSKEIPFIKR